MDHIFESLRIGKGNIEMIMSKTSIVIDNTPIRKNVTFIRIGTKSSSSYLKAVSKYDNHVPPPLI